MRTALSVDWLPAPAVIVFADDRLAISSDTGIAVVGRTAELPGFVAGVLIAERCAGWGGPSCRRRRYGLALRASRSENGDRDYASSVGVEPIRRREMEPVVASWEGDSV